MYYFQCYKLEGFDATIDWTTVVTRIKPIGFDGLELPEKFIDSPLVSNYPYPKIREIEYKDIKAAIGDYADDEDAIPLEDAYAELRRLAGLEYSQAEIDRPTATYDVQFVRLMNTNEYKNTQIGRPEKRNNRNFHIADKNSFGWRGKPGRK